MSHTRTLYHAYPSLPPKPTALHALAAAEVATHVALLAGDDRVLVHIAALSAATAGALRAQRWEVLLLYNAFKARQQEQEQEAADAFLQLYDAYATTLLQEAEEEPYIHPMSEAMLLALEEEDDC